MPTVVCYELRVERLPADPRDQLRLGLFAGEGCGRLVVVTRDSAREPMLSSEEANDPALWAAVALQAVEQLKDRLALTATAKQRHPVELTVDGVRAKQMLASKPLTRLTPDTVIEFAL